MGEKEASLVRFVEDKWLCETELGFCIGVSGPSRCICAAQHSTGVASDKLAAAHGNFSRCACLDTAYESALPKLKPCLKSSIWCTTWHRLMVG